MRLEGFASDGFNDRQFIASEYFLISYSLKLNIYRSNYYLCQNGMQSSWPRTSAHFLCPYVKVSGIISLGSREAYHD